MAKNKELSGKEFFSSLYEEDQLMPRADYEKVVSKLAIKASSNTMFGDQALQSMLVSFVHENAQSLDDVKSISAVLAGIKMQAIESVTSMFPHANVDELISSSKAAGFDVKII